MQSCRRNRGSCEKCVASLQHDTARQRTGTTFALRMQRTAARPCCKTRARDGFDGRSEPDSSSPHRAASRRHGPAAAFRPPPHSVHGQLARGAGVRSSTSRHRRGGRRHLAGGLPGHRAGTLRRASLHPPRRIAPVAVGPGLEPRGAAPDHPRADNARASAGAMRHAARRRGRFTECGLGGRCRPRGADLDRYGTRTIARRSGRALAGTLRAA